MPGSKGAALRQGREQGDRKDNRGGMHLGLDQEKSEQLWYRDPDAQVFVIFQIKDSKTSLACHLHQQFAAACGHEMISN